MSQTDQDQATAAHGKIIARAWRDPAFKAKLLADPHATLKEAGLQVREGVTVKVVENTDNHVHVVLPPKPTGELTDAELDKVAGGIIKGIDEAVGALGQSFLAPAGEIGGDYLNSRPRPGL